MITIHMGLKVGENQQDFFFFQGKNIKDKNQAIEKWRIKISQSRDLRD